MKAKVAKPQKQAGKSALLGLKKGKADIVKAKEPKKAKELVKAPEEVKAAIKKVAKKVSPATAADTGATVPLTFAEKKALSVKRKAKPAVKKPQADTAKSAVETVAKPAGKKTKKNKKGKKGNKAQANKAQAKNEVLPPLKGQEQQGKQQKGKAKAKKSSSAAKKKKAAQKRIIPVVPQRIIGEGEVPTEASPETLALVPKELVSRKIFRLVLEELQKRIAKDEKAKLFGDDLRFALQIAAVKIPDCPTRNCRLSLPHAVLRKEDDVCLIVKDLERGRKYDYENTLCHWQDKLREAGVTTVTQIIPFQQLKQDYKQYEMRRKLVHRFERFLVDARIAGHVFSALGTHFTRRKKNPTSVVLEDDEQLAENIEKALRKVTYGRTNTGLTTEIKFAATWMPIEKAVENGMALLEGLKTEFPGGWLNVASIHVTTASTSKQSLLLYMSMINPNLVPVPKIEGPRAQFVAKQNAKLARATDGQMMIVDGVVRSVQSVAARLERLSKKEKREVPAEDDADSIGNDSELDDDDFEVRKLRRKVNKNAKDDDDDEMN
ncbi:ribosomal L1 domain-containing protein CG13096-like [Anopheles darlingi]|uniref:ribosomal L1 domain-containing protein CG13096-like n=1 Tax=Anopheles darlingi TaxID=43151 RepID=UPI002100221A|nr:ribosomal L1 domain-containing protein CG13096-like [Anopheles darlingi]